MIKIEHLNFKYSKNGPLILNDISLNLKEGSIGIFLGKNGSGKTTLFNNILGLQKPQSGNIFIEGKDVTKFNLKEKSKIISYVPQELEFGNLTVKDTILTGRISSFNLFPSKVDKDIVNKTIGEMKLESIQNKLMSELSGGEKQKVAIARALVKNPKIIIFDEPTANLDIENELLILKEAKELSKKRKITILIAIHDLNTALNFGDEFFFFKEGKIVAQGNSDIITTKLIKEIFNVDVTIKTINKKKIILNSDEK